MRPYSPPLQLAFCLVLSSMAIAVGCRSVHGNVRPLATSQTVIPPLSATTGVVPVGATSLTTAPMQLAETSIPAGPALEHAHASSSSQNPGTGNHFTLPPPVPGLASRPTSLPPVGPAPVIQQVQNQAECLPSEMDWRKQMEAQTAVLMKRLAQVEGELTSTRSSLQEVNLSLQKSQVRIEQLNSEVAHWKGEVQRLEGDMKAQQLADLKSLDELTASMHQVLLKQRPAAPVKVEPAQ